MKARVLSSCFKLDAPMIKASPFSDFNGELYRTHLYARLAGVVFSSFAIAAHWSRASRYDGLVYYIASRQL